MSTWGYDAADVGRGIDLSSLTPAERTVFAGGALLFANGFVPWWFRTTTVDGTVTYNAGLADLSVVAVIAGAAAALVVLARAWIWPEPAPRRDSTVYGVLALVGTVAVLISIVSGTGVWLGHYAGLILALVLGFGALHRARERETGWL